MGQLRCKTALVNVVCTFVGLTLVAVAPLATASARKWAIKKCLQTHVVTLAPINEETAKVELEIKYDPSSAPWICRWLAPARVEVDDSSLPWPFPRFLEFSLEDQYGHSMLDGDVVFPCLASYPSTSSGPIWNGEIRLPISKKCSNSTPTHVSGVFRLKIVENNIIISEVLAFEK